MATREDSPSVFDYLDYRAYLRSFYEHSKRTRRGFSYRAFSRAAGLGSPNQLKRVIDGDRNLTTDTTRRFIDAIGLTGDAAEYFEELVAFGQAQTSKKRSEHYARLTSFSAYRRTRRLDLAHADYHREWYIPAIRELAGRADFRDDSEWIARRLVPSIKTSEARKALRTLLSLGLLERDESGKVVQAEPLVSTGAEMHAVHIADYHRMMMERAAASIDLVPSDKRDISAVTLLVSPEGLAEIKERMKHHRRELLELALRQRGADQVVQVNFQVFPLSTSKTQEPSS